ncbi:hypothetical protein ACGRSR_09985 [Vibrio owensii]|uniref:hypothetical protein n=1 Tax=Vibrio owensii TaxID=696485 RepID=UPI00374A50ED
MARITQEERKKNKEKYDELIFKLFVEEGWESVTLDRVSKILNIRKSTLQGYYPEKMDFMRALEGKVYPEIIGSLDFSSSNAFVKSWATMLVSNRVFKQAISMILINVLKIEGTPGPRLQRPIIRIINELAKNVDREEAEKTVGDCFGVAIMSLIFPSNLET